MLKKFHALIIDSLGNRQSQRRWKIGLWVLVPLTIFLTTYLLLLPAITVDSSKTSEVGLSLRPNQPESSARSIAQQSSDAPVKANSSIANQEKAGDRAKEQEQQPPLSYRGADYLVTVSFTKAANIPNNAELKVTELKRQDHAFESYKAKALAQVEKQDKEIKTFKLYDISILSDGKEIEPAEAVKVDVTYDHALDAKDDELQIVHFKDDGQTEVLASKASAESQQSRSDVAFKTNSFSIYAIVQADNSIVPRFTYHFQNNDGTDYHFLTDSGLQTHQQILKNGESLGEVGIPIIKPGEHFNGWYTYDLATGKYGDPIVFGQPVTVTQTKEIIVRPFMNKIATVTLFDDSAGKNIYERYEVPLDSSGKGTADLSTYKVTPPSSTLLFVGWSKTADGSPLTDSEIKALAVSGDLDLYPVFKESHKMDFDTGDLSTGVTYVAPRRLTTDQLASTVKPTDPTRKGYTFTGWYTAENGGSLFDFNQYLTSDTVLYAHWAPAQTTYTINYWQQSITDSKTATDAQKNYEYAGQVTRSGLALSRETLSLADINANLPKGFKVNDTFTQTSVMIKDDGSSVINVYYDRQLVTIRFAKGGYAERDYLNNNYPWTNSSYAETYTGLYGTTLAANGYQWKTGSWRYLTTSGYTGMSYLGEFIAPGNVRGANPYDIRLYPAGQRVQTYLFYKQALDGSYVLSDTGGGAGADVFTFTEKYTGFNVKFYQRLYQDNSLFDAARQQTSVNTTIPVSDSYYDNYGSYYREYLNLKVWYERKQYKIHYLDPLDNTALPNFEAKDVLYEENLSTFKPVTTVNQPKPSLPGYVWDGKWYKDQAQTQEFNFNTAMPAHDVKVYAGWKKIKYKVNIDPNGGQLSPADETYLDLYYGEHIPDYKDISRDYLEDSTGTYYYKYDTRESDPAKTKTAYYTKNTELPNVRTSPSYKYEKDAYKLIGWYYVNPDGTMRPYNFSGAVTQDITIKAIWRKVGDYHLIYSNNAVGFDGKPVTDSLGNQVKTSNEPIDADSYDDASHSALLRRPTMPDGYRFRGWWYNGKLYNPYDSIVIDAHLADAAKNITINPVIIPIGDIKLGDTSIKYDGNGGTKTLADGSVVNQVTLPSMDLNSTTTIPENDYFAREGYNLIGWNHDKDLANTGHVEFKAGQVIGIDNEPDASNILYAVWQPKTYTVSVSKTVVGLEEDKARRFIFETSNSLQQANLALKDGQTKTFVNVPYGTAIRINEQVTDEFKATEHVVETNLANGASDKAYDLDGEVALTVKGDVAITFTNTRIKQKVRLEKVNAEKMDEPLAGAVFDIYAADAAGHKESTPLYTHVVTNKEGFLIIGNENYVELPLGKYYFTETQAPPGYLLPKKDLATLVIATDVSLDQDGNSISPSRVALPDGSTVFTFKITNSKGTELPSTGGIGTYIYLVVGLLLALPAGLLLYYKKVVKQHLRS
ncbi:InlB B-repeat-containing protein [Streptococcus halichoeri]|uniref:InlB B-repeat-containing protein n=1 Tax=Streptococcus halichoeri TaxID=254785 RepID=UPI00135BFEB7|nr:InlB B-repeat-containing protein [Streptococcus halichoeri]